MGAMQAVAERFLQRTDLPGADPRWLGVSVAQYGCVVLPAVGIALARDALSDAGAMVLYRPRRGPVRVEDLRRARA
jgi:hypothetical protein